MIPTAEIKIRWVSQTISKDKKQTLQIILEIPEGLHIQAHKPAEELLIPTKISFKEAEGISLGEPVYPRPIKQPTSWSKVLLLVYEGRIEILIPIQVSKSVSSGMYQLEGTLLFQGCTENLCLPPKEQKFALTLNIS